MRARESNVWVQFDIASDVYLGPPQQENHSSRATVPTTVSLLISPQGFKVVASPWPNDGKALNPASQPIVCGCLMAGDINHSVPGSPCSHLFATSSNANFFSSISNHILGWRERLSSFIKIS